MAMEVLQRAVRRETHSPRTAAAVVVLVLIALAAIYAGVEIVLHLVGAAPLLVAPGAALAWIGGVPAMQPNALAVVVAVLVAAVGIVLVWLAVSPGLRAKHELGGTAHAVIADNGVIASSLAERVRRELDLSKGAVVVGIGHRSADIAVRPEPGQTIDKEYVRAIADAELSAYALTPRVKVRARVLQPAETEVLS